MDDRELLTILDNRIDDHMSDNQNSLNYCLHNSFTSKFKTCQLYEPNTQLPITVENKNLFLLHVNIRSVNKNLDKLNHDLLQLLHYLPDVVSLRLKLKTYQPVILPLTVTTLSCTQIRHLILVVSEFSLQTIMREH